MTIPQLTNEVLALPLADRAALAERLWESVINEEDESDEELFQIAKRRLEEMKSGIAKTWTHEEVMAKITKAIQCG
jgi:putative addiction module component (TIGR02574 family)